MSRTLTLIHDGWTAIRALARSGRRTDALAQVKRLLAQPNLPTPVAAESHRLAAELLIELERYAEARQQLRTAAKLEPKDARTQYLTGLAFEQDPHGDDLRAALRFKTAATLEPRNALYRAAFGRAAVRCNRVKRGARELLAAAEMDADHLPVLRIVVDGLLEAGRVAAARRVLMKARFLRPRCVELHGLWQRVRFESALIGQSRARYTQDASFATDGDIALLPFVRVVGLDSPAAKSGHPGTIRWDALSATKPHMARARSTKADR